MSIINYSIIIPHKNCPNLLQRCIDSIPRRNDIQIIIVDDNSDSEKVNYDSFPGHNEKRVEVYFTKEGKGAGYARNVALSYAIGKWILFADADDFFTDNLNSLLDKYLDSNYDIIYFNAKSVYSDTLEIANRNTALKNYFAINEIDNFKYSFYPPWCKIIRRSLISENQISFSETLAANDAIFSVKIGWHSKNIKLDPTIGYCVTYRRGSLEQTKSIAIIKDRIYISLEVNQFYKEHSIHKKCDLYYRHLLNLMLIDKKEFLTCLKICNSYGHTYLSLLYNMFKRILKKNI